MKAETFTVAILRKMSDIGMCQKKFIVHLVVLLLSMRSRVNYLMLYCYGKYSEKSYHTPGVGYFWSGCAGSVKWGLELSALAIGDIENQTALHYHAWQTEWQKGTESLRIWYAKQLCSRALELQQMTKILTADAFFSKKPFVDMVCAAGFTFVSRLQHNSYLRYAYTGEQKPGRGRRKAYGGKIDLSNLDTAHFTLLKKDEHDIAYVNWLLFM